MQAVKEAEFEQYYTKYYQQAYGYIARKVLSHEVAEDIAMDAFYACWSQFDRFDANKASFHTWLFVVINNRLKNYYRDHKITEDIEEMEICGFNGNDELMESANLQMMRDYLYHAIEQLPEIQKTIVICRYFKDMNSNEISEYTGLTPGNVRVRLTRATNKIREYFNERNIRWE